VPPAGATVTAVIKVGYAESTGLLLPGVCQSIGDDTTPPILISQKPIASALSELLMSTDASAMYSPAAVDGTCTDTSAC
jgi:hypothetical protein